MLKLLGVLVCLAGAASALADTRPAETITHGQSVYQRCAGCHSLQFNRTGPKHCGLFGRRAGGLPDYDYSPALRAADIVWSEETLESFLAAPLAVVPGTTMGFAGVKDAADRRALIVYLKQASEELCHGADR